MYLKGFEWIVYG